MSDTIVDNTTPDVEANTQDLVAGDTIEYNGTFVTVQTAPVGGNPGSGVDRKAAMAAVSIPFGLKVRRISATTTFTDFPVPPAP